MRMLYVFVLFPLAQCHVSNSNNSPGPKKKRQSSFSPVEPFKGPQSDHLSKNSGEIMAPLCNTSESKTQWQWLQSPPVSTRVCPLDGPSCESFFLSWVMGMSSKYKQHNSLLKWLETNESWEISPTGHLKGSEFSNGWEAKVNRYPLLKNWLSSGGLLLGDVSNIYWKSQRTTTTTTGGHLHLRFLLGFLLRCRRLRRCRCSLELPS